jgi:hypothetical protein
MLIFYIIVFLMTMFDYMLFLIFKEFIWSYILEKIEKLKKYKTVLITDTGSWIENIKAFEIINLKELGQLTL